jgi:hypothetical protein
MTINKADPHNWPNNYNGQLIHCRDHTGARMPMKKAKCGYMADDGLSFEEREAFFSVEGFLLRIRDNFPGCCPKCTELVDLILLAHYDELGEYL